MSSLCFGAVWIILPRVGKLASEQRFLFQVLEPPRARVCQEAPLQKGNVYAYCLGCQAGMPDEWRGQRLLREPLRLTVFVAVSLTHWCLMYNMSDCANPVHTLEHTEQAQLGCRDKMLSARTSANYRIVRICACHTRRSDVSTVSARCVKPLDAGTLPATFVAAKLDSFDERPQHFQSHFGERTGCFYRDWYNKVLEIFSHVCCNKTTYFRPEFGNLSQQNWHFMTGCQDIFSKFVATLLDIFDKTSRYFSATFVATKQDTFGDSSGHFQLPCLWAYYWQDVRKSAVFVGTESGISQKNDLFLTLADWLLCRNLTSIKKSSRNPHGQHLSCRLASVKTHWPCRLSQMLRNRGSSPSSAPSLSGSAAGPGWGRFHWGSGAPPADKSNKQTHIQTIFPHSYPPFCHDWCQKM